MAGSAGDGEFGLQIAPMLDILFVLLLFFMVSAGAQKHEASLSTQLPGGGQPGNDIPVRVDIDANGQVSFNEAMTDTAEGDNLPELVGRLKAVVGDNPKQPVIVTPTRSTRHQRVVDVLNACAAAGVKNLAFGTPE